MAYLDSMTSNGCPAAGLDADRKGPAVAMAANGAFKDIFLQRLRLRLQFSIASHSAGAASSRQGVAGPNAEFISEALK